MHGNLQEKHMQTYINIPNLKQISMSKYREWEIVLKKVAMFSFSHLMPNTSYHRFNNTSSTKLETLYQKKAPLSLKGR